MASESLLEKTLVAHPELLMPGLRLVGRQTPTEGGPLDLLGVDEEGRLVVFELKRGTLSRDAVAQVIDYASYLDSLDDGELCQHISHNSARHGIERIENFEEWYGDNAQGDGLESLRPIRTVLVGLGVDNRTERMVTFLAKSSGMDISLLTFYGFSYEGKTLLARQLNVESTSGVGNGAGRRDTPSKAERWEHLVDLAKDLGVHDLFVEAVSTFRRNWTVHDENVGTRRIGLYLRDMSDISRRRYLAYARVAAHEHRVDLLFYSRAVELCPDGFQEAIGDIPFDTYPKGRKGNPLEPGTEIQFRLTAPDWDTHRNTLIGLIQAVYDAVQQQDTVATSEYEVEVDDVGDNDD